MTSANETPSDPIARLCLAFAPALAQNFPAGGPLEAALRPALIRQAEKILNAFGIPGTVEVTFDHLEKEAPLSDQFFQFYWDGQRCRYADVTIKLVYSYLTGSLSKATNAMSYIEQWLVAVMQSEPDATAAVTAVVVEFFQSALKEIIQNQLPITMGASQLQALRQRLHGAADGAQGTWPPEEDWLRPVILATLRQGISIANLEKLTGALLENLARSPRDAAENVIAALAAKDVQIWLAEETLRNLMRGDVEKAKGLFPFLRDGMYVELGFSFPPFHFTIDNSLKPDSFAFKINDIYFLPQLGIPVGQILVNDTTERLTDLIEKVSPGLDPERLFPALNPATFMPASIVPGELRDSLEVNGLTTWDTDGYLILCFAARLRKNVWRLCGITSTQAMLDQLKSAFPQLVEAVLAVYSLEQLSRWVRELLAEEISIRNLRLILERLLDDPFSRLEAARLQVLDDRPGSLGNLDALAHDEDERMLAFLRAGLKPQISNKYARGTETAVVYLLDQSIEELIMKQAPEEFHPEGPASLMEGDRDRISRSLFNEVTSLPPTARAPAILTSIEARAWLKHALREEFPGVDVIAYDELRPDLNIQPVARIFLE